MSRWAALSANELSVLEGTFWLHGPSRDALSQRLAFSRTHVNAVIAGLLDQGWLDRAGQRESSGGRRAVRLCLHPGLGVLLCADLGATSIEVAVLSLDLQVMARHGEAIDVRMGPGLVLSRIRALMREVLGRCRRKARDVLAIGQMLASVVNFFNPSHVFVSGGLTRIGPLFLASLRQCVYQRSLALSTRHLEVGYTPLGDQAGLIGAGVLALQELLRGRGKVVAA